MTCTLTFKFGPCPIHKHGGDWVHDLYCSQDNLASLLSSLCLCFIELKQVEAARLASKVTTL